MAPVSATLRGMTDGAAPGKARPRRELVMAAVEPLIAPLVRLLARLRLNPLVIVAALPPSPPRPPGRSHLGRAGGRGVPARSRCGWRLTTSVVRWPAAAARGRLPA